MTVTKQEILEMIQTDKELKNELTNGLLDETVLADLFEKRDPRISKFLDKETTRAISSFKEKGMVSILEAERQKAIQEFQEAQGIHTDPKMKELSERLKELEEKNRISEMQTRKETIKNQMSRKLNDKKLPLDFVDFFNANSLEDAETMVETFTEKFEEVLNQRITEKLKGTNTIPESSDSGDFTGKNPFSTETFNLTEQARLMKEDPEKAEMLRKIAKK